MARSAAVVILIPMALGAVSSKAAVAQDTVAALAGVVTHTRSGEPLMGARVLAVATGRWTVTDAVGAFELSSLAPGRQSFRVSYIGRAPFDFEIELEAGQRIEVAIRLDVPALPLAEVTVEAGGAREIAKLGGFYERAGSGPGRFITREDIDRRAPRQLSDMLRIVPGLAVECSAGRCQVQHFIESRRVGGPCPIQYFVNGVTFLGDIDEIAPDQVEGIEIHRNLGGLPPQFNVGTSMCGVIAVWLRIPG